jgi:hypothetical protein
LLEKKRFEKKIKLFPTENNCFLKYELIQFLLFFENISKIDFAFAVLMLFAKLKLTDSKNLLFSFGTLMHTGGPLGVEVRGYDMGPHRQIKKC